MAMNILIAYATKLGSTQTVADAVAQVLAESGFDVRLEDARRVRSLDGYDAVVLGTAIRIGRPIQRSLSFARRHRERLRQLPVALFSLGTAMREDTPENRQTALSFLVPLADQIGPPLSVGLFGGVVVHERLAPFWRFMFKRDQSGEMREGDWRDWGAIRSWALDLADRLRQRLQTSSGNIE